MQFNAPRFFACVAGEGTKVMGKAVGSIRGPKSKHLSLLSFIELEEIFGRPACDVLEAVEKCC